jgi:hypothetical protein
MRAGDYVTGKVEIALSPFFTQPYVQGTETGRAAGRGRPVATAAVLGQQAQAGDPGSNLTWCGDSMSQLLAQWARHPVYPKAAHRWNRVLTVHVGTRRTSPPESTHPGSQI